MAARIDIYYFVLKNLALNVRFWNCTMVRIESDGQLSHYVVPCRMQRSIDFIKDLSIALSFAIFNIS